MSQNQTEMTNGRAAAAILSAGVGCFLIGLFFLIEDASSTAAKFFTFYMPVGPLSGTTTTAVVIWLVLWFILAKAWKYKTVRMWWVNLVSFGFLALSLLLTFPPFIDFLQGK